MPRKNRLERPSISIVGPGNLGSALAKTLADANYPIKFVAVRAGRNKDRHAQAVARRAGARLIEVGRDSLESDVVWITVPDDAILQVASTLAAAQSWKNRIIFHSSGALTSDELAVLRDRGARVASVHPMMTFVRGMAPELAGVSFAIEGDAQAVRRARAIVEDLGANHFIIRKQNKALYHVFGSFASPLVIALLASMEQVASAAGIRPQDIKPIMVPLLWQTLRNYLKQDAAAAFSGPLVRGDVTTIQKHLAELKKLPEARQVYIALAAASLRRLPVKNKQAIQRQLHF